MTNNEKKIDIEEVKNVTEKNSDKVTVAKANQMIRNAIKADKLAKDQFLILMIILFIVAFCLMHQFRSNVRCQRNLIYGQKKILKQKGDNSLTPQDLMFNKYHNYARDDILDEKDMLGMSYQFPIFLMDDDIKYGKGKCRKDEIRDYSPLWFYVNK